MTTTTAARTARARTVETSVAAPVATTLSAQEANDRAGALLMTLLVGTFFVTVAVVYWMAHTVHV